MPKVSIIMPSKNVRPYIEQCMESVLGQTLQDIEVLCVDADSTDGTHEILERYAAKDSRVHLLRDDQHSTGYAKNLGIDLAKGKYVAILEPDDYVAPDMYEQLYEAAERDCLEIVKMDYAVYVTLEGSKFFVPKKLSLRPSDYNTVMNPQETLIPFGWEMYTWAGIYRTDFLRTQHIRHHETKGATYQDIGFWFQAYACAKRVGLIPGTGYYYCQDNPDASVKNEKRLLLGLDELEWLRRKYDLASPAWAYLQAAWGNAVLRFTQMAYFHTTGEIQQTLITRAHEMVAGLTDAEDVAETLFWPGNYPRYRKLQTSAAAFAAGFEQQKNARMEKQKRLEMELADKDGLVIVSAGSNGANLQALLKAKYHRDIAAFADNDKRKQGTDCNAAAVLSVEEAVHRYPNACFLIANLLYGEVLEKQLAGLGIPKCQICHVDVDEVADVIL